MAPRPHASGPSGPVKMYGAINSYSQPNPNPETCPGGAAKNPKLEICGGKAKGLPFAEHATNVGAIRQCAGVMANCICEVIGDANCKSISEISKSSVKQMTAGKKKLSKSERDLVLESATSKSYDRLAMEKNARLANLAVPLAYRRMLGVILARTSGEEQLDSADADDDELKDLWLGITMGVEACHDMRALAAYQVRTDLAMQQKELVREMERRQRAFAANGHVDESALADISVAQTVQEAEFGAYFNATKVRDALVCSFRLQGDLPRYSVYESWPGCGCTSSDTGRRIGGTCFQTGSEDVFTKFPIDSRMPDALAVFSDKINQKMKPLKLSSANLIGCGVVRVERGGNVVLGKNATFGLSDVSEHAQGVACDMNALAFTDENCAKCNPKFDMALDCKSVAAGDPLADACSAKYKGKRSEGAVFNAVLEKFYARNAAKFDRPAQFVAKGDKRFTGGGFGSFYRKLEDYIQKSPDEPPKGIDGQPVMSKAEWFQLRAGVVARNALVDAGLIPFDPTTNSAHVDHFHFELPREPGVWDKVSSEKTDPSDREALIEPNLKRAAGIK
ncbi:MAG: hypothetical protein HY075_02665 [Deltaproteobacteria bacterium]|nr:hypothetical protein [Deltaproteobacteria bacterium]